MTKRIFKDTLKTLSNDPSFIAEVAQLCFETLPPALAEYLAKQAYINYALKDPYYVVTDLLSNTTEYFFTINEIHEYIVTKYPSATRDSIYKALKRGQRAHNHEYKKVEPTV